MADFLKDVIKTTGNEYAALVSEGVEAGDVDTFIDTGSYIFNALLLAGFGSLELNRKKYDVVIVTSTPPILTAFILSRSSPACLLAAFIVLCVVQWCSHFLIMA